MVYETIRNQKLDLLYTSRKLEETNHSFTFFSLNELKLQLLHFYSVSNLGCLNPSRIIDHFQVNYYSVH